MFYNTFSLVCWEKYTRKGKRMFKNRRGGSFFAIRSPAFFDKKHAAALSVCVLLW